AAAPAMNNRNRAAPIALAGNTPVAETVVDPALANPRLFHPRGDFLLGVDDIQTIEKVGGDEHGIGFILFEEGLFADGEGLRVDIRWCYDGDNRQIIAPGKLQIALVVGGTAEYCAFAVGHEDEISSKDRQANILPERMARIEL